MKVVKAYPPNISAITERFGVHSSSIVYTYGDTLYNPTGQPIDPPLMAHEEVHSERQLMLGVDLWWRYYLERADFRFREELLAYQAQYQAVQGRAERRKLLDKIAGDLAGPIYGNLCSKDIAKDLIVNG